MAADAIQHVAEVAEWVDPQGLTRRRPAIGAGQRSDAPKADVHATIASDAGGRYLRLLCGRIVL